MTEPKPGPLTINGLVDMAYGTASANGWHDLDGEVLTEEHPVAQIAGLSMVSGCTSDVIEAIRKPATTSAADCLDGMKHWADMVHHLGAEDHAHWYVNYQTREMGQPVIGSKTRAISMLRLIDTETSEATEAVLKDDTANLAEELADITIRVMDFVGAWNASHPDKPIDLEATILAKNKKNKQRGYRHGGKKA